MLFNSLQFLIFFPVVTLLYFWLPQRYRWGMLLAASCIFYMAAIPIYIFVLFTTIVIDYCAALLIDKAGGAKRRLLLVASIASTCAVLFIFKYFNFFNYNIAAVARFLHVSYPEGALSLALPIGLSFHTFQSLSYVIEVYRGNQKVERHFGIYALYVMFYPQLVAGPIERPYHLLHQFYEKHVFEYQRVTDGLKLMLWGMFKKIVIADRLSILVNQVYNNPRDYHGMPLVIATVFFAFQIYCDFSGYSDVAIGAAQVMGFKLMDNFNRPYFAKSIAEFWRRWHISLSSWFRDYVYIPLGGSRVSEARWYFNILCTFLISGLWHGAHWKFVIWGALHGLYVVFSACTSGAREYFNGMVGLRKHVLLHKYIQVAITFTLVSFAWIFFRGNTLSDCAYIVTHLFSGCGELVTRVMGGDLQYAAGHVLRQGQGLGLSDREFFVAIALILFLECVHGIQRHGSIRHMLKGRPLWVRWSWYYLIVLGIIFLGVSGGKPFIYFQF